MIADQIKDFLAFGNPVMPIAGPLTQNLLDLVSGSDAT